MSANNQQQERIDILEEILLRLHHGAEPDSVQEDFNKHFTGVSAIEISLMEHQLMNGDSGITFEDVLKLCNVHANLFKNTVEEGSTPDADKPGHPVQVFKDENHAFRAALIRINNILNALEKIPKEALEEGILSGLRRQFDLLGQFDIHYERKEKLFFPLMEKYGHDAPPKVMWAKDDEIRDQFKIAYQKMTQYPDNDLQEVKDAFAEFEFEFKEMIFKEEAILINILLEALDVDDWYQIARESYAYGYAIIRPTEEWIPEHVQTAAEQAAVPGVAEETIESVTAASLQQAPTQNPADSVIETRKIAVDGGFLTVSWEPRPVLTLLDPNQFGRSNEIKIGDGYLTLNQIELLLDYVPIEITLVDAADIVRYSNYFENWTHKPFYYRDYHTPGRSVETIYQRPLKNQVLEIVEQFKAGGSTRQTLIDQHKDTLIKIDLIPIYNQDDYYEGYIELAHNLAAYDRIKETPVKRRLTPLEEYNPADLKFSAVTPVAADTEHQSQQSSSVGQTLESHKLSFAEGELMLTWEHQAAASPEPSELDRTISVKMRNGELSLDQVKLILNSLPFEITFVDHHDRFQYYNNIKDYKEMIFVRTPAQVKRDLELCHPPFLWPMISGLIQTFRDKKRFYEELWYPTDEGKIIYTMYQPTYDAVGDYTGMVETVLNVQPLLDLEP